MPASSVNNTHTLTHDFIGFPPLSIVLRGSLSVFTMVRNKIAIKRAVDSRVGPRSVQNHETACSAATTSRLQVSVRRSHSAVVPPRCVPAGRVGTEPSWRLKQGDHFPALLYTAPNNCHAASHR